jgi:hypothetical protein
MVTEPPAPDGPCGGTPIASRHAPTGAVRTDDWRIYGCWLDQHAVHRFRGRHGLEPIRLYAVWVNTTHPPPPASMLDADLGS